MRKMRKKISMGVLAAVVVATPMIAISCGSKDSEDKKETGISEEAKREAERKAKEIADKKAKADADARFAKMKMEIKQDAIQEKNIKKIDKTFREMWNGNHEEWIRDAFIKDWGTLTAKELIEEFKKVTLNSKGKQKQFYGSIEALGSNVRNAGFIIEYLEGNSTFSVDVHFVGDTIYVEIQLKTPGATDPNKGHWTFSFEWINNEEINQNKEKAIEKAKKDKEDQIARAKWEEETKKRVAAWSLKGYIPVGNSYEVWYNKKEETLIEEYGKYSQHSHSLSMREEDRDSRYDIKGSNIFYDEQAYPIKKLVISDATSILDTYGSTVLSDSKIEEVVMPKVETVSSKSFAFWRSLNKVVAPNLKNFKDGYQGDFAFRNNNIKYWDLSQISSISLGKWGSTEIPTFRNNKDTTIIISKWNKMDQEDWRKAMQDSRYPVVKFKKFDDNGKLVDLKWKEVEDKNNAGSKKTILVEA